MDHSGSPLLQLLSIYLSNSTTKILIILQRKSSKADNSKLQHGMEIFSLLPPFVLTLCAYLNFFCWDKTPKKKLGNDKWNHLAHSPPNSYPLPRGWSLPPGGAQLCSLQYWFWVRLKNHVNKIKTSRHKRTLCLPNIKSVWPEIMCRRA